MRPLLFRITPATGRPISVYAPEGIRGKTGPAPSGALLFRPFSWAMQEKGQGNRGRLGVVRCGRFDELNAGSTGNDHVSKSVFERLSTGCASTSTSLLRQAQHMQRKQRRETG